MLNSLLKFKPHHTLLNVRYGFLKTDWWIFFRGLFATFVPTTGSLSKVAGGLLRLPSSPPHFGYRNVPSEPFRDTFHIVLRSDDCCMSVRLGKPRTLVIVAPFFKGRYTPKSLSENILSISLIGSVNLTISVSKVLCAFIVSIFIMCNLSVSASCPVFSCTRQEWVRHRRTILRLSFPDNHTAQECVFFFRYPVGTFRIVPYLLFGRCLLR